MIEEEPPDPLVQQGPVGGGIQEIHNLPEAQQRSPDSLPDFDEHEPQTTPDALGDLMEGVQPEEIPASPKTPGDQANAAEQQPPPGLNAAGLNAADALSPDEQIEQVAADNAFAVQLQADEQIVADNALARQLLEPHSITVPRQWPANG